VIPLGPLNVITGPNGSGKSNLYRALRLLAETAQGGVVNALAREGGLNSTLWAGPETVSRRMRSGEVPVQGGPRQHTARLRLGFASEDFGYAIALGLPTPSRSAFALDPAVKGALICACTVHGRGGGIEDMKGPRARGRSPRSGPGAAGRSFRRTSGRSTAC
jgi:predicted ATPase